METIKSYVFSSYVTEIVSRVFKKTETVQIKDVETTQLSNLEQKKQKLEEAREFHGLITNKPCVTVINGSIGSGKTELLIRLLLTKGGFYKQFKQIIIISPTFLAQWKKTWSKIDKKGIRVFNGVSDALCDQLERECNVETGPNLIISDDNDIQWRKNVKEDKINHLISCTRHADTSYIFLSQSITQLNTIIRNNASVYVMFSSCSYRERELLWKENSTINRKKFHAVFEAATKSPPNAPYSFLVCSKENGGLRFFRSFNEELDPDEEFAKLDIISKKRKFEIES